MATKGEGITALWIVLKDGVPHGIPYLTLEAARRDYAHLSDKTSYRAVRYARDLRTLTTLEEAK